MATKKLSHTVIEGGRAGSNKWERRYSHREDRAEARDYCKRLIIDPEYADEEIIDDLRVVYKEFTDKLSPMYRWLKKQVGRSWSKVRSEVSQKFDTRTTAGRHITYDHLLREVVDTESGFDKYGCMMNPKVELIHSKNKPYSSRGGYSQYYVDENDILCENINYNDYRRYEYINEDEYSQIGEWLDGRMIIEKEGKFWWFLPMEGIWKSSWIENKPDYYTGYHLKYYLWDNGPFTEKLTIPNFNHNGYYEETIKRTGMHWEYIENPFSFRQRSELNKDELKIFKSFKNKIKNNILAFGKGR